LEKKMSSQEPIYSGFGAETTASEVMAGVDLGDKVAVVTGGYSGLGLEAVEALAAANARVIIPARSTESAAEALDGVRNIQIEYLDLMDPASIDAFASKISRQYSAIDILVNSAGIMASPLSRDRRGFESQLSTNHLGHFQLADRLWDSLVEAQGARIVSVSSAGHRIAGVDFDDINFDRRPYDKWVAYGQSKSANALFAVAADKRGRDDGLRAFSLHPGSVVGPLARHLSAEEVNAFGVFDDKGNVIVDPSRDLKTLEQGAATILWCATSAQLEGHGGVYCENCDVARISSAGSKERGGVKPWAIDPEAAERLWTLSMSLID
jgi:NAD(P)-dependent dehydrogenase (short-subunit alcohol dehydrogenase family)